MMGTLGSTISGTAPINSETNETETVFSNAETEDIEDTDNQGGQKYGN